MLECLIRSHVFFPESDTFQITTAIERSLEVMQYERAYFKRELEATSQRFEQRKTTFQKVPRSFT